MDHAYIDANALAERYVMGQLSADERERFEEHFVECASCQQHIEASRGLREGFRVIGDNRITPVIKPGTRNWVRPVMWMAARSI